MSNKSIPRIGVGVFAFRNDGKFLMGKRLGSHGEGTWSVPGGHLEFGETPEQTAAREILEETGLVIENITLGAVTNDIFMDESKHYVTLWMISKHSSGTPKIIEPDKFVEIGWYDFDNLPEPLFLPWKQLMVNEHIADIMEYSKKIAAIN